MQILYVATTLCRSMILGRDWLEGNKAHMSFNPVMVKLGGKEIPLENCMNKAGCLPRKNSVAVLFK